MASLQIGYTQIQQAVAAYLGYNLSNMTTDQSARLAQVLLSGVRQAYWPPPLPSPPPPDGRPAPAAKPAIRWSFLHVKYSISLVANTFSYTLPEDYSGNLESLTYDDASGNEPLHHVTEGHLRSLRAADDQSGDPDYYAIYPASGSQSTGQAWAIEFYPTPLAPKTVIIRYDAAPPALDYSLNVYPYGGPAFSELVLASCLAAAEQAVNDGRKGTQHDRFMELLAAAVQHDAGQIPLATDDTWPYGDPGAQTLDATYDYLLKRVGREFGLSWDAKSWHTEDRRRVDMCIHSGLRQFYTPPPLKGDKFGHEWSFLRPIKTLTTAPGVTTYDLPDDFAAFDGPLTFDPGSTVFYRPIEIVAEHQVRSRLAAYTASLRPEIAAIRPKAIDETTWTRYEILFAPNPDDAYLLTYRYRVNCLALSQSNQYPPGAQPHAETILESCLAAAELMRDSKPGVHTSQFQERLAASVSADRRSSAPDFLGYNGDRSDRPIGSAFGRYPGAHWWSDSLVSYNGVIAFGP